MTKSRDPEALLSAYLVEGMQVLPDRVADAVLDEIHRTRQRAVFNPRTTRSVARTAVAAAAVVAAVVLGGAYFVTHRAQPAVIAGPSQSPSAYPSPSLPGPSTGPSAFPRATGVWIPTGAMGSPRAGHSAVRLLDGRVLVIGGGADESDSSAELYDPDTGSWSATGDMLKPRSVGFAPILLRDGRVLVGGVDDTSAEVYDPAMGRWSATGNMVTASNGSAVLMRDGKVLVMHQGGSAELYDPGTGTWTATGNMIAVHTLQRPTAVVMPDGKVLEAGGGLATSYAGDSAELYDPDRGTWTAIASLNEPLMVTSATLLFDGTALVMGRCCYGGPTSAELYDPATGTWTATGDVARPGTNYQSATLLLDGMVLAAGGNDSPDAELYDPGDGSWATTGSMLRGHTGSPATPLLDGTVLVAGGSDCVPDPNGCLSFTKTGTAELYVPAGVSPPAGLPAVRDPNPTATPFRTPTPTPVPPHAGPIPPNARVWTVTVVNKSDQPATLFVADENEQGLLGRLVGSATPNAVPAGATVEVTFLLPAKGVAGWSIFVNPRPNEGALVGWKNVPLAGEIRITADGQVGWLSP